MNEGGRRQERRPTGSFWRSVKMVSWAFFGIRKGSESQADLAQVKPLHIIAVGMASAVIFVVGLIVLVQWVVDK